MKLLTSADKEWWIASLNASDTTQWELRVFSVRAKTRDSDFRALRPASVMTSSRVAAKRSKIPMEKFFMNIEEYANTSAASIPIALSEMCAKGLLKKGDLILTFGFGAGLTYGGNLIRW